MPASSVTVTAVFEGVKHTVTVADTANGTAVAAPAAASAGETVTLTVTPDPGCRLSGLWAGEDSLLPAITPALSYVRGSEDGAENGNTRMLIDGSSDTKRFSYMSDSPYIIIKDDSAFCLTDYTCSSIGTCSRTSGSEPNGIWPDLWVSSPQPPERFLPTPAACPAPRRLSLRGR